MFMYNFDIIHLYFQKCWDDAIVVIVTAIFIFEQII